MATEANYLRAEGGYETTMDKAGDTGLGETDDMHSDARRDAHEMPMTGAGLTSSTANESKIS